MEEAPIIKRDLTKKTFEITSDKKNNFLFTFKNIKSASLLIEALFDDGIVKTFFKTEFTLEKIKENKAFLSYDTIDEILEELFPLIDENKIHLFEEEEGNKIKLVFDLPFKKYKNIDFLVSEKKKINEEKINELYNIVITQNKEIKDLKSDLYYITNKLEKLVERMSTIEKENKKALKKQKYEDDIIINTKSDIFSSLDEIDFIIRRLKQDTKLQNKKIVMKLLFKATRDGQHCSNFHSKCDKKVQQLIIIKTTKGEIFGGYTEEGFRSRNDIITDNNAFVFSFSTKKIYNVKYNQKFLYDYGNYGPYFIGSSYGSFCIHSNMLESKSFTCTISHSYFDGMTIDYELNNGEKYFYIQEIEVYQILYN